MAVKTASDADRPSIISIDRSKKHTRRPVRISANKLLFVAGSVAARRSGIVIFSTNKLQNAPDPNHHHTNVLSFEEDK
jgi:hypothetical protein